MSSGSQVLRTPEGRPGTLRHKRYQRRHLLSPDSPFEMRLIANGDATALPVESLWDIVPEYVSPFERLLSRGDSLFDAFLEVDVDDQEDMLDEVFSVALSYSDEDTDSDSDESGSLVMVDVDAFDDVDDDAFVVVMGEDLEERLMSAAAVKASIPTDLQLSRVCYERMNARVRASFKRRGFDAVFVDAMEHELDRFFFTPEDFVVVDRLVATFTIPNPYHRHIFHGVCQYHGLVSFSETLVSGDRVTRVHRPLEDGADVVRPPLRLVDFVDLWPSSWRSPLTNASGQ